MSINPPLTGVVTVEARATGASVGVTSFGSPMMAAGIGELTYPITAVANAGYDGADYFTVAKGIAPFDNTQPFQAGEVFRVVGSTANDGFYTVESVTESGDNWEVTVAESIPDATADGDILIGMALEVFSWSAVTNTITLLNCSRSLFTPGLKFRVTGSDYAATFTVISAVTDGVNDVKLTVGETIPMTGVDMGVARFYYINGDPTKRYTSYASTPSNTAQAAMGTDLAGAFVQGFSPTPRAKRLTIGAIFPGETVAEALSAIRAATADTTAAFYGFTLLRSYTSMTQEAAAWAETDTGNPVFWAPTDSLTTGIGPWAAAREYARTIVLHQPNAGQAFAWEALCNFAGFDPDQQSIGFANAVLPGLTAGDYSEDDKTNAEANRISLYGKFTVVGTVTYGGKCANGYSIALRQTLDWSAARVAEAAGRVLKGNRAVGNKIPFTDEGIAAFRAPSDAIGQHGIQAKHFVPDSWFVDLPLAANVPDEDKAAGLLQYECRAVYASEIERVAVVINVSASI